MLCPAWYSQVQNLWRRRTSADIVDSQLANDNQVPGLEGASVCAGVLGLPRHDGGAFALHGGMAALAIRAISPIPFTTSRRGGCDTAPAWSVYEYVREWGT